MDGDEIVATKNESMKVHVVFIDSGVGDAFAVQRADYVDVDIDDEQAMDEEPVNGNDGLDANPGAKKLGPDFSSEPGYDLLAGTAKGIRVLLAY
jgi:hypothetical protein